MLKIFKEWEGDYEVFENDEIEKKDNLDGVEFEDGKEFHIRLIPVRDYRKESKEE